MAGDEPYQCHQWVGRKFWRGLDFFISPHSPQHGFSHLLFIHCSFSQFHNKLYFGAIKFVIIFRKLRKVCFVPFHFLYPKALRVFIRKYFARILKVQHYFKKQQIHGWVDQRWGCGRRFLNGLMICCSGWLWPSERQSRSATSQGKRIQKGKRIAELRGRGRRRRNRKGKGKSRQGRADAIWEGASRFMFHA